LDCAEEDGVGEDDVSEERADEGVGAFVEELADVLGHSDSDESGAGEFVLGEDEEDKADGDAQEG